MVTAKGVTNGSIPMGAVFARDTIYEAFMQAAPADRIELFHGYTYSGHPVACAAGLATLDTYKEEELFSRSTAMAPYWADALHDRLSGCRHVIDIRNLGLMGAIELESRPGQPGQRAFAAFRKALDEGILIRTTGDVIALSPPLIISRPQIDEIIDKMGTVLLNLD
jgi:Adenosylmethionine-8-amino-7-oxononanoate aminotransferase